MDATTGGLSKRFEELHLHQSAPHADEEITGNGNTETGPKDGQLSLATNAEDGGMSTTPTISRNAAKKRAKRGKKVQLYTNYVRVFIDNNDGIHEYKVNFSPPIDNLEIRKRLLQQFDGVFGETRVFDGIYLFLPFQLNENKTVLRGFHPKHSKVGVKVTISYIQQKPHREMVVFFNVLLRRLMTAIGKYELKRNFLDRDVKFPLPHYKLEIWPGICTSVEEQEDGLMLCLDTSYRVFRTDTVYDYICAINDFPGWEGEFRMIILGAVVITRYNNMTYKIVDIDWDKSPSSSFDCNGQQMTYQEYYKSQYNIEIKDPNQPLLISCVKVKNGYRQTEKTKMISIVPELCYETGMKQEQRNDIVARKELAKYTFSTPAQKLKTLSSFIEKIHEIPEALAVLEKWNVRIDKQVLEVTAREIPGPLIQFGCNGPLQEASPEFSSLTNDGLYDAVPLKRWLIICSQRDVKYVKRFRGCYKTICSKLGIGIPHDGEIVVLKGQNPQDFRDALEDYVDPKMTQFVVVVMPYVRRDIYSVVKTFCCVENPLPSQVVLAKHLASTANYMGVVKNLAMQINCKLGGSLWGLQMPLKEKIMFVGIDVYHDVKKMQPSVVGVIASMNNSCSKYFSKIQIQKIHQEVTVNSKALFSEALECFFEINNTYPDRVIVFRDGGSLSTVNILLEHEVKPMLSAIDDLCPGIKFTYTSVSKRVPQRFFLKTQNGFVKNPNGGTVIDESVTYPNMFDFYLVSQNMTHRVINPTHYMVIYDVGGISPDLLQQLAYSTTYMYYNQCESIRVPAMIQYAHKLSALVGQYLRTDPAAALEKTLYYL